MIVSNSTVGQRIAFEHLKERVVFMRKLRGENVYPVVMLSSKSMRTKFGMKQRPDFEIDDWRTLGGSPAIASAPVNMLPGSAVAKPAAGEIIGEPAFDPSNPNDNLPDYF